MDKKITIRFYEVEKLRPNGPDLRTVLEGIRDLGGPAARENNLGPDYRVRLETLEIDGDQIAGEFTRAQTTNYPSEVHDDGLERLNVAVPLGHGIAFRFRPADHVLAIQYETRVLSPGKIFSYLMAMRGDAAFDIKPRMNETAWRRMQERPLKKLKVRLASPADLANIEDAGAAAANSFRDLGRAYDAPSITVELGMGGRRGALPEATKQMARQFFDLFREGEADLRGLKAVSETEPGVRNDEINLIDEILSIRDELELPDNDPERNYRVRRDWLKTTMQNHG